MIDIVKYRYWYFLLSLLLIIPGIVGLILFGLRLGIDFTGGSVWQVRFERGPVEVEQVRQVLSTLGERFDGAIVQSFGADANSSRTSEVSMRFRQLGATDPLKDRAQQALERRFGPVRELTYQSVGAAVGSEIARRSILAIALSALGILLYIAWAFRRVSHPWRYGTCAIVAMLHDVIVVVGLYSLLGEYFGIEVDALFVTALLTVIGFSVHDTIVVFDRIRENQLRRFGESFASVVNYSLVQTLVRSINTSLTVLITLTALYLFGGVTIKSFVLALLIGIFSGTYSSIFNASLLLVIWENGELGRLFGRGPRQEATSAAT